MIAVGRRVSVGFAALIAAAAAASLDEQKLFADAE